MSSLGSLRAAFLPARVVGWGAACVALVFFANACAPKSSKPVQSPASTAPTNTTGASTAKKNTAAAPSTAKPRTPAPVPSSTATTPKKQPTPVVPLDDEDDSNRFNDSTPQPGVKPIQPGSGRSVTVPATGVISSFGRVSIGDTVSQVHAVFGMESGSKTYAQEEQNWLSGGLDIKHDVIFLIGFDQVLTFDDPNVPVWKVFLKNGKVVVLKITAKSGISTLGISPSALIGSTPAGVQSTLGATTVQWHRADSYTAYHYLNQGVSFIGGSDIQVIDIYGSLSSSSQRSFATTLTGSAPKQQVATP